MDNLLNNTVIDSVINSNVAITEDDLIDPLEEDFANTHLIIQSTQDVDENIQIPIGPSITSIKTFTPDIGTGFFVTSTSTNTTQDFIPWVDLTSAINMDDVFDFYLHPGLLPRKRRRLRLY